MTRFVPAFVLGGIALQLGWAQPRARDGEKTGDDVAAVVAEAVGEDAEASGEEITLLNPLPSAARVVRILPDGSEVEKGDLVCLLDAAPLRDTLLERHAAAADARAEYEKVRKRWFVAQAGVREFVDAFAPLERKRLAKAIEVARTEAKRVRQRLERVRARHERGLADDGELAEAEIAAIEAAIAEKEAEIRDETFREETYETQFKLLQYEVYVARDEMWKAQESLKRAEERVRTYERRIEQCRIRSPVDGVVRRWLEFSDGFVQGGKAIVVIEPTGTADGANSNAPSSSTSP